MTLEGFAYRTTGEFLSHEHEEECTDLLNQTTILPDYTQVLYLTSEPVLFPLREQATQAIAQRFASYDVDSTCIQVMNSRISGKLYETIQHHEILRPTSETLIIVTNSADHHWPFAMMKHVHIIEQMSKRRVIFALLMDSPSHPHIGDIFGQ